MPGIWGSGAAFVPSDPARDGKSYRGPVTRLTNLDGLAMVDSDGTAYALNRKPDGAWAGWERKPGTAAEWTIEAGDPVTAMGSFPPEVASEFIKAGLQGAKKPQ